MSDDDELLPLRSINAHAFCPRLFWFEEKAGLFEHNEHTVQGEDAHRRVGQPGGAMPAPEVDTKDSTDDVSSPWHTRDLWLSSPSLGITGKLDFADEEGDNRVVPVDTKKGKPRSGDEGLLWPADEVQLTLQALLLEEAGYVVDAVAAYYRAARKRVRVPLTDALRTRAKEEIAAAKKTLALVLPPEALLDSPKCRGCSLNAICQPDEVNALHQSPVVTDAPGASSGIRRVVPESADRRPLVVSTPGARVGIRKGGVVLVTPPEPRGGTTQPAEKPTKVGLSQVSHIAIVGTAQMSTQALRVCLDEGVPVTFSSTTGRVYGLAVGEDVGALYVRMAQHAAFTKDGPQSQAMAIAKALIADKVANQRVMLRRNAEDGAAGTLSRLKMLVEEVGDVDDAPHLLAKEGEAAKLYWKQFSSLCGRDDEAFAMQGRSKRPPKDRTNAMISFCAGLLVRDCKLAVRAAGLDAQLGVFHVPLKGRPSMALDLMEPFRPLVIDSVVLGVIRRGEVQADGFVLTGQAVAMKQATRRSLIQAYERRMAESITHPLFGYRISYRQTLFVQARLLARVLVGELDEMPSFRTR